MYWTSACPRCPLKAQCTTSDYRRITRWEHEAVLEAMQQRLDRQPEMMRVRRQTVEHPFGTIKAWMGWTHFLTQDAGARAHRDEPARAGLQPEARDAHPGHRRTDARHAGLGRDRLFFAPNSNERRDLQPHRRRETAISASGRCFRQAHCEKSRPLASAPTQHPNNRARFYTASAGQRPSSLNAAD